MNRKLRDDKKGEDRPAPSPQSAAAVFNWFFTAISVNGQTAKKDSESR